MENNNLYDVKQTWLDITKLQAKKSIYTEIIEERQKQDIKWGQQNHPIVSHLDTYSNGLPILSDYDICNEERAKFLCNWNAQMGSLTWGHIIIEELVEAMSAKTKEEMRTELIQCAAVIIAMIESLERNGK
jgi:hypothetical protein